MTLAKLLAKMIERGAELDTISAVVKAALILEQEALAARRVRAEADRHSRRSESADLSSSSAEPETVH